MRGDWGLCNEDLSLGGPHVYAAAHFSLSGLGILGCILGLLQNCVNTDIGGAFLW